MARSEDPTKRSFITKERPWNENLFGFLYILTPITFLCGSIIAYFMYSSLFDTSLQPLYDISLSGRDAQIGFDNRYSNYHECVQSPLDFVSDINSPFAGSPSSRAEYGGVLGSVFFDWLSRSSIVCLRRGRVTCRRPRAVGSRLCVEQFSYMSGYSPFSGKGARLAGSSSSSENSRMPSKEQAATKRQATHEKVEQEELA